MIVICHGLMQPKKISNGLAALRREICDARGLKSVDVPYCGWTEGDRALSTLAGRVNDAAEREDPTLVGHSWGVWWLAYRLAPLVERPIAALFSCDGVMRPPRDSLVVPPSVRRVWRWHQQRSAIKGSALELSRDTELMRDELVAGRKHAQMDEYEGFHEAVLKWLKT